MTNKTSSEKTGDSSPNYNDSAIQIAGFGLIWVGALFIMSSLSIVGLLLIGSLILSIAIVVWRMPAKIQAIGSRAFSLFEFVFGEKDSTVARRIGILILLTGVGLRSWPVVAGAFFMLWLGRGEAIKEQSFAASKEKRKAVKEVREEKYEVEDELIQVKNFLATVCRGFIRNENNDFVVSRASVKEITNNSVILSTNVGGVRLHKKDFPWVVREFSDEEKQELSDVEVTVDGTALE